MKVCPKCHTLPSSALEPYAYLESGLSYVTLMDVTIETCRCGKSASIPAIVHLHQALYEWLKGQKRPYTAEEVRFIATHEEGEVTHFPVLRWEVRPQVEGIQVVSFGRLPTM
jgi:hypothetical protein